MADCQGPMPGPYPLKPVVGFDDHCQSKSRAPAYSLGLKLTSRGQSITPGPYKVENVDRRGRYPYMGWTMESRATMTPKPSGPSPLDYAPERYKPYTPAYSLGLKIPTGISAFGPSPAEYFPQYSPKSGFTIGNPYKHWTKFVSPGPQAATPTDLYKNKAPAYSLGMKGKCLVQNTGPGPKYYPNRLIQAHAYSFGLRHGRCAPPLITHDDNDC